jgi:phenylpropionate dioxygenase-like ring-hydroxylating dioxygenase large terminal subunit
VRVKLLSERLLAFRDSQGRYGLIDEFCAHRGVSLWFGRNEENGLRCPYHGWKYDVTGQCVEVPSEPAESGYCKRIKLKSYPLIERGGVLWTYMGAREKQPPLPEFEFALVAPEQRFIAKRIQESNWLQALEGGIDSSHVSWLHRGDLNSDPLFKGAAGNKYNLNDARPVFEVVESPGGLYIGVRRNAEDGHYYWRITPWVMPSFTMIPPRGDHPVHGHFWIPIDDHNCWTWSFDYHVLRALTGAEVQAMRDGKSIYVKFEPGTFRPLANKDNDYLIDRVAQKAGTTFSGVKGIAMQDASLQESMGPIVDRTKENLVSTDNGIIMARHRMLKAIKAQQEQGATPPGVDPAHQRVRSAAVILPPDQPFTDGAKEALAVQEGVAHATV